MQLGVLRDPVEDAAPNAVAGGGNASAHSPSFRCHRVSVREGVPLGARDGAAQRMEIDVVLIILHT